MSKILNRVFNLSKNNRISIFFRKTDILSFRSIRYFLWIF